MSKLSQLKVQHAKPGRHSDGNGLYLLVSPSETKSWVLRIQVDGRRRDFGLGPLNLVGLGEARDKAREWRKLAKQGFDPSIEAKRRNAATPTFEEAACEYHESVKSSWKNGKHRDQWINTLRTYAFPSLGKTPVDQIDASKIQGALLPIWQSKPETARRVRQRIGTILDYCCAMGWRGSDAPMRAVNTLLKAIKQPKKGHFPAMPFAELPDFLKAQQSASATIGRLALTFLVLTAGRSGEVRGASWEEINLEDGLWTISGDRMKMGEAHCVPLSSQAITLLKNVKTVGVSQSQGLIFPGLKQNPLSDMTLSKVLKDNGATGYTVHGFRSSFRDWAAENGFNNDWAEAALAHTVSNRVAAAYKRTKFVDQRKGLMQRWSDFCLQSTD